MVTHDSQTKIPDKLYLKMLSKCLDNQINSFQSLITNVAFVCPGIVLKSKNRYSAFYRETKIITYVEPQLRHIKFGFFADYINVAKDKISIPRTTFPDWNTSKGGLIGYKLQGNGKALTQCVADIAYLIIESFKNS